MKTNQFKPLEQLGDIETAAVLKASAQAHRALGELKGTVLTIPNQKILLSTLPLQEAKESSEIENIITTNDDLYRSNYRAQIFKSAAAKEVHNYAKALEIGYEELIKSGLITNNLIVSIQQKVVGNNAGFRTQMGTALKNDRTQEIIYTPPQSIEEIQLLMKEMEDFINNNELSNYDDLVKMALIHHRFESIHPFYDGNGRTGRILNILFLCKQDILDTPILYLSRFINQNKSEYYRLLQVVRNENSWEPWLLYMLKALETIAMDTVALIKSLVYLMKDVKIQLKSRLPKIYSHELINNLFSHPYTKIDYVVEELEVHRNTAAKYLELLTKIGLLEKMKLGKDNYYLNKKLFDLLSR